MEVRKGYKMSEIGIIPIDWEAKPMKHAVSLINGKAFKQEELLVNGKYLVLRVGNFFSNSSWYYSNLELPEEQYVNYGDLMYAWSASFGPKFWFSNKTIYHYHIWKVKVNREIDKRFMYYLFEFDKQRIHEQSQGGTMFHITKTDMELRKIPLPPYPEQQAIAEVLSDTDNLIQALEKQIAKKRLIKQGAMQKLLTPKENWNVKKLGDISKTYGGLSGKTKEDFQNGLYPYIPFMNILSNPIIDTTYYDFVKIGKSEIQNKALKGDLFFNGSSETPEEVGMCSVLLSDVESLYLNSFCFGLRLFNNNEFYPLYLSYFFRSGEGRKLIYSLAQGATRYNLSKTNFLKLEFPLPNFKEQIRIAHIINDMDSEISALEKKLHKAQQLKQGLMQNLLTGKIRLMKL